MQRTWTKRWWLYKYEDRVGRDVTTYYHPTMIKSGIVNLHNILIQYVAVYLGQYLKKESYRAKAEKIYCGIMGLKIGTNILVADSY